MKNNTATTYIALLRGINVSGKNMIKMPALAGAFEELSFAHVRTYVQSGNVIFEAAAEKEETLQQRIQEQISRDFKADVPVLVLRADSLVHLRNGNPFLEDERTDLSKLHITFLSHEPDAEMISKIETDKYLPDTFVIQKQCIYLYCPGGYGKTKLTNNFFESKLKQIATTRNWNTVNKLIEMAAS
ncbi:hypothetical protein DYBT9275_02194 [Dyadobacter sp. CECT 9275]|uniref:DUF1697 domain-containing protein n=1 Tax=Dyadobacter helix TaxID=2822344 RepID=A0A916NL68_9BACT|nr:DUF1697 domain-containing protein [Dyadobacter sp. CECT 9275]CAG4999285.1 hypothetical protein DYBT9275_02194 [Dyadobacter sp. CECT 9275]